MGLYVYKAVDSSGKSVKGELEAQNELDVSTQLAKQGYMPVSISFKAERTLSFAERVFSKKGKKASTQSLIVFTRQFATIVKAAVPIVEGLGVLAEQSEDESLKDALNYIIKDVESGMKLSESLAKHPRVFSELYVSTVVAGEAGGVLDKVLLRLADVLEEDNETKANVQAVLRYPIMVGIALLLALFIFSYRVIPQFSSIYAGLKSELPMPTQVMIAISNALQGPWKDSPNMILRLLWYVILIGINAGIVSAFKWYISTTKGRIWWDGFQFKVLIFGKLYSKVVMLRFASMLNLLYQAGLPILNILDIVKVTMGNVVLSQEINTVKRDVADGKGISGGILGSKLFPRLVGYMISVGEKTGSLSMMLDSLCDYFTLEVKTTIRNLTSLIEPIMTLVLGAVVAFMALSIFMPLWGMIQAVKQAH